MSEDHNYFQAAGACREQVMSQKGFSFFQEGAKRFEKAMKGVPDRVPVLAQMHEFAMNEIGAKANQFYTSPELLVPATLEIQEKYGLDIPFLDYDVYNIEAEGIGQEIIYSEYSMPDVNRTKPLIRVQDDLRKIKTPDFNSAGRFGHVIEMNRIFRRLIGGGTETGLSFCAPFSLAANIRGIEQLLMDIYDDPSFARSLFDRVTEDVLVPWILCLKKEFPNAGAVVGSDAVSSLPIVNLNILREWIVPYIMRLRKICGPEVYVPNWVGESHLKEPGQMLDLKRQVCPGFVEGQDPDVERLGPEYYKQYAQKHGLPLILGVGASFLASSGPEKVVERVRHYIDIGGENGRFALYLCNLGATTPAENVKAVIETVLTHGVY